MSVNLTNVTNTVNGMQENLNAWFEFLETGLRIRGTKGSSSGSYLNLAANEVALYYNDSKKLWLTAEGANAEVVNVNNYVQIGTSETGKFLWEAYPNGFRLRKVV